MFHNKYTYRMEVFDGIPSGTFSIPIHFTSNLILPKAVQLQKFGSEQQTVSSEDIQRNNRLKIVRLILADIASATVLPTVIRENRIQSQPNTNDLLMSRVQVLCKCF